MGVFTEAMKPSEFSAGDDDPTSSRPEWGVAQASTKWSTEEPLPLYPALPPSERYPVKALGPCLSEATAAISRKVQVPDAVAAQSVLATAALAAQAHADVELPYGQTRPLSLFFITVAGSGDRKSTADNEALLPIRRREQALREQYSRDYAEWKVQQAAWAAEKRKIDNNKQLDLAGRIAQLRELGPEPPEPLHPFLTAADPTVEGLVKAWVLAPASLGMFSGEGGQFIGGHGMSPDNRLKTAATLSQFWDGQPIKRLRAMDGVTILGGRRLSAHLMVQPDAAAQFLCDPILRNQGILSRFFVAAPQSIAGTRFYRSTDTDDEERIRSYASRILAILEAPWSLRHKCRNELAPRVLRLDPDATAVWREFHDHVEGQSGQERELADIQDFAAKAAEHAARIAGVLTVVRDLNATTITIEEMNSALMLVDWYVNEALRLQLSSRTDPSLLRAQALLDWLQQRSGQVIEFRDVLRLGPKVIRQKKLAEEALAILKSHFWIEDISSRPRQFRLRQRQEG